MTWRKICYTKWGVPKPDRYLSGVGIEIELPMKTVQKQEVDGRLESRRKVCLMLVIPFWLVEIYWPQRCKRIAELRVFQLENVNTHFMFKWTEQSVYGKLQFIVTKWIKQKWFLQKLNCYPWKLCSHKSPFAWHFRKRCIWLILDGSISLVCCPNVSL